MTTMATDTQHHTEDAGKSSVALGAGMMLVGLLLGFVWVWLCFFRRSKSPRNGMTGSSGQVGRQSSAVECFTSDFWECAGVRNRSSRRNCR